MKKTLKNIIKSATMLAVLLFAGLMTQTTFAANFTTPFTTPANYTKDAEIDVSGGLASLKESGLWSGLIAYWDMNELSGNIISDKVGSNDGLYNGLLLGSTAPTNIGTSIGFDGDDDSINLGTISSGNPLMLINTDVTFSFWVKWNGTGDTYQRIFDKSSASGMANGYGIIIHSLTKKITMYVNSSSILTCSTPVTTNTWEHYVVIYRQDGNHECYRNSISGVTGLLSKAITDTQTGMTIGTWPFSTGRELSGYLGEIAIWNRTLTSTEVTELYNAGNGKELKQYSNGTFSITKTAGDSAPNVSAFTNFVVTKGTVNGSLSYQLSTNGTDWKYWDGSAWSTATTQANSETVINANISSFPSVANAIYVKTFMTGDGTQAVEVDEIQIGYSLIPNNPTTAPDMTNASDTGTSNTDNNTTDTTPTFDVVCSAAGNIITLYVDGVANGTHTCAGVGTEQITADPSLTDGTHNITYTDKDANGESGASPVLSITIDTTAPAQASVTSPTDGSTTNDTTPTFTGTGEVGATVNVDDGNGHTCSTTVDANGDWSCDIAPALTDGDTPTFAVTQTDPAGNTSSPAVNVAMTIDTSAPATPTCTTSPSDANNGTNVTTTCTGVEVGTTVTIPNMTCTPTPADATETVTCTGTVGTGAGEITATNDTVTVTDGSGNTNTSSTTGLTVDNTAPAAPTINTPTNGNPVTGTAEAGSTVVVTTPSGATCTTTADATGNYSCTLAPAPVDGEDITANATDAAGNTSPDTTEAGGIDSSAPTSPTVDPVSAGATTITGTGEVGTTITIDPNICSNNPITVAADGIWSCTVTAGSEPNKGDTITATSTDDAGNTSTGSYTIPNPVTGGGSGGSEAQGVQIGTCSVTGNMCQTRYPYPQGSGDTAYETYTSCIVGQSTSGKHACAVSWAIAKGYVLCDSSADCSTAPITTTEEQVYTPVEETENLANLEETEDTVEENIEYDPVYPAEEEQNMEEPVNQEEIPRNLEEINACEPYLVDYLRINQKNDENEVKKLQRFLKEYEGYDLGESGYFDQSINTAVIKFQEKYAEDVLAPWNAKRGTGWVYKTTKKKINELYCLDSKKNCNILDL